MYNLKRQLKFVRLIPNIKTPLAKASQPVLVNKLSSHAQLHKLYAQFFLVVFIQMYCTPEDLYQKF